MIFEVSDLENPPLPREVWKTRVWHHAVREDDHWLVEENCFTPQSTGDDFLLFGPTAMQETPVFGQPFRAR